LDVSLSYAGKSVR